MHGGGSGKGDGFKGSGFVLVWFLLLCYSSSHRFFSIYRGLGLKMLFIKIYCKDVFLEAYIADSQLMSEIVC